MKLITFFSILWGLLTYILFTIEFNSYPKLKDRFGNLMWQSEHQSSIGSNTNHNYCYYPKNPENKNFLKRQDDLNCKDYYGQVILPEKDWQSEKDKIWLSKEEYISEIQGKLTQNTKNQQNQN